MRYYLTGTDISGVVKPGKKADLHAVSKFIFNCHIQYKATHTKILPSYQARLSDGLRYSNPLL